MKEAACGVQPDVRSGLHDALGRDRDVGAL
jgi:hypothetical protein